MFTLMGLLVPRFAPAATPILLLSYVCESNTPDVPRYELMLAAGVVGARLISEFPQPVTQEASKVLSASELAQVQRSIDELPGPSSNYAVKRPSVGAYGSLLIVSGSKAWNVTYSRTDLEWNEFSALLQWIEMLHQTKELRALRPRICGGV